MEDFFDAFGIEFLAGTNLTVEQIAQSEPRMVIDENMMINKWMYYPKGATEPAMTTSFEDYKDYEGIKIATNHRSQDGSLNIYFSDINIIKD